MSMRTGPRSTIGGWTQRHSSTCRQTMRQVGLLGRKGHVSHARDLRGSEW